MENKKALPSSFYLRGPIEVARDLLGKGLYVRHHRQELLVEIVEVEAYLHNDPASHSFRGMTRRNAAMFESGGTCYVYLSYGINWCMNVVTGKKGVGEAILLRAAIPRHGLAFMQERRGVEKETALLSGPGKLCQGMAINADFNGCRFDREDFKLIDLGLAIREKDIGRSPRIGITKAADECLRFFIKGSPWLSRKG